MTQEPEKAPTNWRRAGADRVFFPAFALLTTATAFFGFTFTYFSPMLSGSYPDLSPFVHLHGWSFFIWYLLFPAQAFLIAFNRTKLHMMLGRLSVVLAAVMVLTGLFVLSVRMDDALAAPGDPFMVFLRLVGAQILLNVLLFALFYGVAIRMALTNRFEAHKRLLVLASSAGLGAALFRVFGFLFGPVEWANTGWVLATNGFMLLAMLYDRVTYGRVHPVYWAGFALAVVAEAALWPFPGNPMVSAVNSTLAGIGELVRFVY